MKLSRRAQLSAPPATADGGPTITAALIDGPLKRRRLAVATVSGRPPATIDLKQGDGVARYVLRSVVNEGTSADYEFLYHV